MNSRLTRDQVVLLETAASRRKTNDFFAVFFSTSKLGGTTKHLMTDLAGNSQFLFQDQPYVDSSALPQVTLRISGKQNSLFPLGSVT